MMRCHAAACCTTEVRERGPAGVLCDVHWNQWLRWVRRVTRGAQ